MFASVIALFADEQQDAAELLGLGFKQIDGGTHGIENRRSAIAGFEMVERIVDVFAGVRVIANEMGPGIESHQCSLAPGSVKKQVEQRAELGEFVELKNAGASLLDGNDQRNRRGVHLFLHANLLRYAVVFQNEVAGLQAVENSAVLSSLPAWARGLQWR